MRAARLGVGQRHAGPRDLARDAALPRLAPGPRRPRRPDGGLGPAPRWTPACSTCRCPAGARPSSGWPGWPTSAPSTSTSPGWPRRTSTPPRSSPTSGSTDRTTACGASGRRTRRPTRCSPAGTADRLACSTGTKPWCSGAGCCDRALVTARTDDGYRLFAVDLGDAAARRRSTAPGRRRRCRAATAGRCASTRPAGRAGRRPGGVPAAGPGFWHGAVGVAAVWWGGARGVARALARADVRRPLNPHALAHAGAVDAGPRGRLGRARRRGRLLRRRPRRRGRASPG